jgi:hypothetical protein
MNDNVATPKWLMVHFAGHYDPNPINSGELREKDGLGSWGGLTFCNPPYSNPAPWVDRAIIEAKKGKRIVLLTRVDTSTKWWLALVNAGFRCAFFHGRIKFQGDGSPNFSSCLWFSTSDGGTHE